jgi:hypothetical protein
MENTMADNYDDAIAEIRQKKINKNIDIQSQQKIQDEQLDDYDSAIKLIRKNKSIQPSQELKPALRPAGQSVPSATDVIMPAFIHGATLGWAKPENYKKLVEAYPLVAGSFDFLGQVIPISVLSMLAGPVVGLGARGMLGVSAATKTANLAAKAVTGASMGATYGAATSFFEGKSPEEIKKTAAISGALWGTIEPAMAAAGMAYKAYKGLKFDKKLAAAMDKQVVDIRSDLISKFKDAAKNNDEAGMTKIKQEFDKYPNMNAGGIPSGTIIEMPPSISNTALARQEPRIMQSKEYFSKSLFSFQDKPALGEFRPVRLDSTKIEIKNNAEEGAKEFTKRRNEVFDVLFDIDNKKLLDATTDFETKIPYRHVKFRVTNSEVTPIGLNKVKPSDKLAIQDGLNELKNNYFNSDIYGTVYKNLMEENLSLDVNGAIKSLKEQSIADQIAGKKLITIKEITNSAKSKGLLYEQKLNNTGAFEFNLKTENGDEIFFPTIDSTNHFLSNYKKGMSIVDRNKLVEGSYQYVVDNAPELVANLSQDSWFSKLSESANLQRELPEDAMLSIQKSDISQLYGWTTEHVGDLIHRIFQSPIEFYKGSTVGNKIEKTLNSLTDKYGFEKEIKEQIISNLKYEQKQGNLLKETVESQTNKLKELSKKYAEEHKKIPVHNEAQKLSRDAAVAVGEWRFEDAIKILTKLKNESEKGKESWFKFITEKPIPKKFNEILLKQEAEKLGIKFNGIQKGIKGEEIPLFTDLKTKSTFAKKEGETLAEALTRKRKEFGITGNEISNVPGEKTSTIRTGIEIPLKPKPKALPEAQLTAKEIIENSVMKDGEALPEFGAKVAGTIMKEGYVVQKDIGLFNKLKTFSYALEYAEQKTKIPVWSKIYKTCENGMRQKGEWLHPQYRELENAWKGIKKQRQDVIGEALETPNLIRFDKNYIQTMKQIQATPELKEKFGNLTEREFNALINTRKKTDEYFNFFGIENSAPYTEGYLPKMKKNKQDFTTKLMFDEKMPENYDVFFRHQRTGDLQPREKNPLRLVKAYANMASTEKFVIPPYKEAKHLLDELVKNKELPIHVGDIAKEYLENVRGWKSGTGYALDQTVRTMLNTINKFGNVGWSSDDIENVIRSWVGWELSLTYSGAMGFRPYTAIRNAFQPVITTLPMVGSKYFLLGLKKALTKEGWDAARSAGHLIEDYAPVPFGEDIMGKTMTSLTQTSLYGIRKSDSLGRVISYWAGKLKADHYGDLLVKDIRWMIKNGKSSSEIIARKKKFIRQSEMDWLSETIQEKELAPLIDVGRMKEVSELYAKHLVEKTQFVYRKANGPVWARGNIGRIAGQFGTWPTWYVKLARSMTKGNKVNVIKRLGRLATVGGLTTIVGSEVFGVDIHKWVWHYPLLWGGPPSAGVLSAAMDIATGSEYDKAKGIKNIQNFAKIHIPGSMALTDLYKAGQEEDLEPMVKRALGFKPVEE